VNPTIPTTADLAADPITHADDDLIAPPGLTNFLGTVRVDHDLTALTAVQFPPVSQGLTQTAALFVDGRLFTSFGIPVTHAWRPDRVVRSAVVDGWALTTTTVCAPGRTAVAIDVVVENRSSAARTVRLGLSVAARVVRSAHAWGDAESPSTRGVAEAGEGRILLHSPDEGAWSIQGVDAPDARARLSGVVASTEDFEIGIGGNGRGGELAVELTVAPGATSRFGYVHAVATSRADAEAAYDAVVADIPAVVADAERYWDEQLAAAFTPGNSEYSGHLPVLDTSSETLRRLYWWAALGLIWFRREFEGNVLGRTYDTLMPNYWGSTTFIWDYSLSSVSHALLDPTEMRRQLAQWIRLDIHSHFGTSSLTGEPVGRWYSVNDYAMTRLVNDYVRFTGDTAFLDEEAGDAGPVMASLHAWAQAWRGLRTDSGSGLADYGEIDNLLECVSSYTHEVASLNAANVWNLRTVAELAGLRGEDEDAARLRAEADELVPAVLALYQDGQGFFAAGQPDGSRLPVRHCYDFSIVGTTIAGDLPEPMRDEMAAFFRRELQTENWMRALSPWDPDASYSVRPDHQWNGAYPAWPADAGRSLIALGAQDTLTAWLEGLVRTANQGPMGQAHFVEEAQPALGGGARKAPPQLPYITDWACSSSGAWIELILDGVFGLRVGADGSIAAGGCAALIDEGAVLRGIRVAGRTVDVHADGRVVDAPA
jgi:hypothetical protein